MGGEGVGGGWGCGISGVGGCGLGWGGRCVMVLGGVGFGGALISRDGGDNN